MFHSYGSCGAKWERARTHLASLRDEIRAFLEDHPYEIVPEPDHETVEYVFRVYGIEPTPPHLGPVIGDVLHNLRCALDHLVYELALVGVGQTFPARSDLTDDEARSCEFPICAAPEAFESRRGKIRLLRVGEQTRIEELQPYNSFDLSIWGPTIAQVPDALRRLHSLEVQDKHRALHPTWQSVTTQIDMFTELGEERRSLPGFTGGKSFGNPLEDGAEVGRWEFESELPDLPPEMDVKTHFPVSVAFGEPWPGLDGVGVLEAMVDAVAFVLAVFYPSAVNHLPPLPVTAIPDPVKERLIPPGFGKKTS